jgi:hypothetical protein
MRFLMMIKANADYEAGKPPSPELMAGMGRLMGEMAQAGVLLAAEGLQPSSRGARISLKGGRRQTTDGPFAEAKELVGGYAILEAPSLAEAKILAARMVDVHLEAGVADFDMEIRALSAPGGCGETPH